MKYLLILLLLPCITLAQNINLKSTGQQIQIKKSYQTSSTLYFNKPDSALKFYKIPLSELSTFPTAATKLPSAQPDLYILKFRNQQLAGIWLGIIGGSISSIGFIAGNRGVGYTGGGILLTGFAVFMSSYSNINKYYATSTAIPYKN